jgi:hypothetical protein
VQRLQALKPSFCAGASRQKFPVEFALVAMLSRVRTAHAVA